MIDGTRSGPGHRRPTTRDLAPPGLRELDKDLAMARRLEEIHSQPGRQKLVPEKQIDGSGASRLAES